MHLSSICFYLVLILATFFMGYFAGRINERGYLIHPSSVLGKLFYRSKL